MSNYRLTPKDENHIVMIGWDPMMVTFFLHVIDTTKAEDEPGYDRLWIGCRPNEILSLDAITIDAEGYAVVTEELRMMLYRDANE